MYTIVYAIIVRGQTPTTRHVHNHPAGQTPPPLGHCLARWHYRPPKRHTIDLSTHNRRTSPATTTHRQKTRLPPTEEKHRAKTHVWTTASSKDPQLQSSLFPKGHSLAAPSTLPPVMSTGKRGSTGHVGACPAPSSPLATSTVTWRSTAAKRAVSGQCARQIFAVLIFCWCCRCCRCCFLWVVVVAAVVVSVLFASAPELVRSLHVLRPLPELG